MGNASYVGEASFVIELSLLAIRIDYTTYDNSLG